MSDSKPLSPFLQFVEDVKSQVPIMELYTYLTKQEFTYIDSRLRALITWRDDNSPSLAYDARKGKNKLTDFTETDPITNKFKNYSHIDLFMKVGGAISYGDALLKLCEYAKVEIPKEFKKEDSELGGLSINLGAKVREVWEACLDNMEFIMSNPANQSSNMIEFFNARNLPLDIKFLRAMNVGVCPKYDLVFSILKDQGILEKQKGDTKQKENNIFKSSEKTLEYDDNALVFPLYNLDGGLCGLKFRQFHTKTFAEWNPTKTECFFNAQRFNKRPRSKHIILVESEMSLLAYGRGAYDLLKDKSENLQEDLEKYLPIIYATGSKHNTVKTFSKYLKKVKYIQDHDLISYEEVFRPEEHPVLQTCTNIATQIEADDFLVVDWHSLPYVNGKFDFEDFIKYHNYDLASLRDIPYVSFPRYAVNVIKQYINTIQNEDNKKQNQIKFSFLFADKMPHAQRAVFEGICQKEFELKDSITQSMRSIDRNIVCGDYSIDTLGRFVETIVDEKTHQSFQSPKTNFYIRISNDITYYNTMTNKREKFYEAEIVINNSRIIKGELSGPVIVDEKSVLKFLGDTCWNDVTFYDKAFMQKEKFEAIKNMIQAIPPANNIDIFASLGRPNNEEMLDEYYTRFKTHKFCLYPRVSAIDGKIVNNREQNFEVNIMNKTLMNHSLFEWTIADEETFRKVKSIFWNKLRHMHYSFIIDSVIAMAFDSCTRELQGNGIVENDHGFPLYIAGRSGRYKSTCALAAMFLMGKFKNPQSDFMGWNGTKLSIEHQLVKVGNLIHALDDLKVEGLKSNEFISLIHSVYGANIRTRMNSSGTEMSGGNKLKCSLIVTSEAEPTDIPESIATRFLVLRIPPPPEGLPAKWEVNLRFMQAIEESGGDNADLMRCIMPKAVAWAQMRDPKEYPQSLRKWKDILIKRLKESKGDSTERPTDMVARIIAAYEQFVTFCKEIELCTPEEGDIAFQELVDFWQDKIELQIDRIAKQSATYKIINLLCQILNSQAIGTKIFKNNKWEDGQRNFSGYPILDITYPDNRGRKLIITSIASVIKQMNALTENSFSIVQDRFIHELQESNIIESGKTKYPIPDERGHMDEKKVNKNMIVIDYKTLMDAYEG